MADIAPVIVSNGQYGDKRYKTTNMDHKEKYTYNTEFQTNYPHINILVDSILKLKLVKCKD